MTEQEKQAHKDEIEAIRAAYDKASTEGVHKFRAEHGDYHAGVKQYWAQEKGASKAVPALVVSHKQGDEDVADQFMAMLDGYIAQFSQANPNLTFWYTGANVKLIPVTKASLVSLKGASHDTAVYKASK